MSRLAVLLALFQAWVAVFVVDQNSSASLGGIVTDCILTLICEVVISCPFSTVCLFFADRSIAPGNGFVKGEDASGSFIARISGTFVLVVANLSFELADKLFGDGVISTSGVLASIRGRACFLASSRFAFLSVRNNFACTELAVTNRGETFQIVSLFESPSLAVKVLCTLSSRWAVRRDGVGVGAFSGGGVARILGAFLSIVTFVFSTFASNNRFEILFTNCRFASILWFASEAFVLWNTGSISGWFGDTSSEFIITYCNQAS